MEQNSLNTLKKEIEKYRKLVEASRIINQSMELDVVLQRITSITTSIMDADRSTLYILDHDKDELWSKVAQGGVKITVQNGKGISGYVSKTGNVLNIPDAYSNPLFDPSWDKKTGYVTRSILCMPVKNNSGKILGVVQILNKKDGVFDLEDEELLHSLCSIMAISIENSSLYKEIADLFTSFITSSARAIDARDICTSGHSRRVAAYSYKIAEAISNCTDSVFSSVHFNIDELTLIKYSGLLHDYGKIGIREHILQKMNRLTDDRMECISARFEEIRLLAEAKLYKKCCEESRIPDDTEKEQLDQFQAELRDSLEFISAKNRSGWASPEDIEKIRNISDKTYLKNNTEFPYLTKTEVENLTVQKGNLTVSERLEMESHVTKSYEMLKEIPWPKNLSRIPEIVYAHHEKLNGTGYPRGIGEKELSIEARILAVADIYDALTAQDRPYKPAIPHEKSVGILRNMVKDSHLDHNIVELFIEQELYHNPEKIFE